MNAHKTSWTIRELMTEKNYQDAHNQATTLLAWLYRGGNPGNGFKPDYAITFCRTVLAQTRDALRSA